MSIPNRQLNDYVPYILRDVTEFQAIMAAAQDAFDRSSESDVSDDKGLWQALEQAIKDTFILDATEYSVARWEKMLGITPPTKSFTETTTEYLSSRRAVILAKMTGDAPYTYVTLMRSLLYNICDHDNSKYSVKLSVYDSAMNNYTISVKIELGNESSMAAVKAMLERVIPCNLLFEAEMMYNRHIDYKSRPATHAGMSYYSYSALKNTKWNAEVLNGTTPNPDRPTNPDNILIST